MDKFPTFCETNVAIRFSCTSSDMAERSGDWQLEMRTHGVAFVGFHGEHAEEFLPFLGCDVFI